MVDDRRLIGHQDRLDADRQIGADLVHRLLDIPAEGQNVAAFPHRNGDADGAVSVHPEHRLRRIGVGSAHGGDVAQPDQPAIGDKIHRQDVAHRFKRPRHPKQKLLVAGLNDAGRLHNVLRRQRRDQRRPVDPEPGELFH